MNPQITTVTTTPKAVESVSNKPRQPTGKRVGGPHVTGGSRDARRFAAAILEVMAGIRTPTDAAAALAISMPRYYIMEKRALEGLISACEPRPKGPSHRPEKEVECLRLEIVRLEKDVARNQALARAAQRTIGLAPPAKPVARKTDGPGKRRRRGRPTVRALKVIDRLQSQPIISDSQAEAVTDPMAKDGQV
jgi:hypothetical protein